MTNTGDLHEFKQLVSDSYESIESRVNYLCDMLLDEEESNSFFEYSGWGEMVFEIEPLIPKNKDKLLKIRLSDYNVPFSRKRISLYAELHNLNDENPSHGSKQEGLMVDFYQNSTGEFQHEVRHISYKNNSDLLKEVASKFKIKYGDNKILDNGISIYDSNFVLSKN
jgi:hypothetical protein